MKTEEPIIGKNECLSQIAKHYLGIKTLEVRNSDRLDFHDVGVASLKDALEAAYRAGLEQGLRRKPRQKNRP